MYGAASLSDAPALQRAVGELRVNVRVRDGRTVLEGLRQVGCLKARFPRSDDWLNVVTLNTSGGIAGGDALESAFTVGAGARATIAAQAAERFYRTLPGSAASRVHTSIVVGDGGAAEWLPQETILFDRCATERRLRIDLAEDAWFLGVESLVFGRAAMGEVVERASLRDRIEVRRGNQLLLRDAVRMDGDVAAMLGRATVADGARAMATLVHVAKDAESKIDAVRAPEVGVSAWDGILVARVLAADGAALRASVIAILNVLRDGRALPRVWLC
jgi:urease accessory protein